MRVLSINRGWAEPVPNRPSKKTGIYKRPVPAHVPVTTGGVAQDVICNKKHHGGPDQAVYLYTEPDYAWWRAALGRDLEPGTFGENLTIDGLESTSLAIGDRLHIGEVVLEVTAPRIPCNTLAARMGDPGFVKRFRHAERPGAYCRVIREGAISAGDSVQLEPYAGERVGIPEMFRAYFDRHLDEATLRRFLSVPVAIRARHDYEVQLGRLKVTATTI